MSGGQRSDPRSTARTAAVPRKGNLLFVDPDDLLLHMIEAGLSLSRPKWQMISTKSPAEALDVLGQHSELDAIVTEVVFGRSSEKGKAFIREVGQRWPEIPLFVMTRLGAEETQGLDAMEYIAKPPDIDYLVSRIDRAIRRQRESHVRGISLPTFLQILDLEGKTCTVVVSHGGRVGELFLRDGKLIQARLDELEGREAFFEMLSMREHTMRVVDRCDAERKFTASLASLLMEWSVREDHTAPRDTPSPEEDE